MLLERAWESNNNGCKILARDACRETVDLSLGLIGLIVKNWKNISNNEFDCRESRGKGRVIVAGSVGKFNQAEKSVDPSRFRSAANHVRRVPAKGVISRLKSEKEFNKRRLRERLLVIITCTLF